MLDGHYARVEKALEKLKLAYFKDQVCGLPHTQG
jgi:hypothetical protein